MNFSKFLLLREPAKGNKKQDEVIAELNNNTKKLVPLPSPQQPSSSSSPPQVVVEGSNNNQLPAADAEEDDVFGFVSYPANDPIEDRVDVQRLDILGGWWFACFDGHGGWQAAEFAQKELAKNLEVELGNRLGFGHAENNMLGNPVNGVGSEFEGKLKERLVSGALIAAFERTDRIYKSKIQGAFEVGFGRDTRAGSCALGALLADGVLFIANLGDSRAVLGVNREAYNALSSEEKKPVQFQHSKSSSSTTVFHPSSSSSKAAEEEEESNAKEEPPFHVTEYLRRAAVMKAHGEKLNPEVEAKLREVLAREVQAQDELLSGVTTVPKDHFVQLTESKEEDNNNNSRVSTGGIALTIRNFITGGPFLGVELSRDHNCREKHEKQKLEEEHPDELDVVVCRRPDVCYIKGKLQPTRSFGDFYLKYSEFMRSPSQHASAGRYISPPYTPPYITATPEISITRLRPGVDDFLILATDGLWDFVSSQEAVNVAGAVLRGEGGNSKKASDALKKLVLSRAAEKAGLDLNELENLPAGKERRRRHDDTTVVVVDLKRAFEFFWWG